MIEKKLQLNPISKQLAGQEYLLYSTINRFSMNTLLTAVFGSEGIWAAHTNISRVITLHLTNNILYQWSHSHSMLPLSYEQLVSPFNRGTKVSVVKYCKTPRLEQWILLWIISGTNLSSHMFQLKSKVIRSKKVVVNLISCNSIWNIKSWKVTRSSETPHSMPLSHLILNSSIYFNKAWQHIN